MKKFVEEQGDQVLSPDDRNLLSVAYKNVVGSRRSAWRIVSACEQRQSSGTGTAELARAYTKTIKTELDDICKEVIVSVSVSLDRVFSLGRTLHDHAKV